MDVRSRDIHTRYKAKVTVTELLSGKLYLAVQDPNVQLELETDGSDNGWGTISTIPNGKWRAPSVVYVVEAMERVNDKNDCILS